MQGIFKFLDFGRASEIQHVEDVNVLRTPAQADKLFNGKSEAEQIKARYQMKLVANMRINYWLFNLLKSSSKISESSERNTLNMKIVNSGMLTYSKMLTRPKWPQIVNIKRRISYMDPVQKYHSKALCYQFQLIYDAEIKNCWLVE